MSGGLAIEDAAVSPDNHTTLVTDTWAPLQWGLDAIDVATAWQAGQFDTDVRVAILDSGVASTHVDIAPNLNTALCTSFVSGEAYNFTGTGFNHGTHVAGIIAAAANGVGTVGVAPRSSRSRSFPPLPGSGDFGAIISGIVYAADIDADVINMSLGAEFPRSGYIDNGTPDDPSDDVEVGANGNAALINYATSAPAHAYQKGVTIVVSAGNSGIDRDHDGSYFVVPADCSIIAVSATGPAGWASTRRHQSGRAELLQHGQSHRLRGAGRRLHVPRQRLRRRRYPGTQVFDMVFAEQSRRHGLCSAWAAGCSRSSRQRGGDHHRRHGGKMSPPAVLAALRASAASGRVTTTRMAPAASTQAAPPRNNASRATAPSTQPPSRVSAFGGAPFG